MNQGHTAEEGQKSIVNVLDGLKEQAGGCERTDKAKNQEISGFILGRDTDEQKAVALASAAVIGKDPALVNTELDRYLKVSPADVERIAQEYFVQQHATVLTVTPAAESSMKPDAYREHTQPHREYRLHGASR